MSVISRSPSIIFDENGRTVGVTSEYLPQGFARRELISDSGQLLGVTDRAYGAGEKALVSFEVSLRTTRAPYPVLQRLNPEGTGSFSLVESAFYPSIFWDNKTRQYHLLYWVNGWSPPATTGYQYTNPPSLFPSLNLPPTANEDATYRLSDAEQPPSGRFVVKDLPNWNRNIDGTPGVGPFDIDRFWIAPITDAHLFRLEDDFQATPGSLTPDQTVNPSATPDITSIFPDAGLPAYPIIQVLARSLRNQQAGIKLTGIEQATLTSYQKMPIRLINLARATRVLMYCRGTLEPLKLRSLPDNLVRSGANTAKNIDDIEEAQVFLFEHPKPIAAFPQGTNKVMCHRQKLTSFLPDGQNFITAPLNYRYPAAGSSTLTTSEPIVDFILHDPSQVFDGWTLGGILPEATENQTPPFSPADEFSFLAGSSNSLVDLLSNPGAFGSY